MKKLLNKVLIPFLGLALMSSIFIIAKEGLVPAAVAVGAISYALLSPVHGHSLHAVEVEIWANYIIERFWKDNAFLKHMFSDDDKVLAGKVVHIPQPGVLPTVIKNRLNYPATAIKRADTDVTYSLDTYTTDPTHIDYAEKIEPSYDKINSVYGDHAGQLAQDVAGNALITFLQGLPSGGFVKTTGGATANNRTGLTGNRKAFTHADLRAVMRKFNSQNVPPDGRWALLSTQMYDELLDSLSNTQYRDFSAQVDAKEGIIGRLHGFNIMFRSDVAIGYDSSGLKIRSYGEAAQSGDFDVSMCWQENALARALGEVKFYENVDRAEYFGDVYSALLRFGGRRRRADDLGVVSIIQDTSA